MDVDFDKVIEIIEDNLSHEQEPHGIDCSYHNGITNRGGKYVYDDRCVYCCIMKELKELRNAENKTQGDSE